MTTSMHKGLNTLYLIITGACTTKYLGLGRDVIVYKHNVDCEELSGMTLVDRHVYWMTKQNPLTAVIFVLI